MNRFDWKNEMPDVPDGVHMAIMDALKTIEAETKFTKKSIKRSRRMKSRLIVPLVAVMAMALGGTVLAGVSLYQKRMEEMNFELLEEFYSKTYVGDTFHFSRELSVEESEHYETLVKEYELNGRFPEGNVRYLENHEDYNGKGIGLYAARSTIFLPTEEMSDEDLLQLIDFEHKLSYSVNTIGTEIVEGNYDYDYDYTQIAPRADGDCVIAYEGNVGIVCVTEGKECLYLAGENEIERMVFGENTSEPFYKADFGKNMVVYAMEEDVEQGLYVLLLLRGEDNYQGSRILHISREGELLYEKELPDYVVYDIAVDQMGRLYLETFQDIYVYDAKGNQIDFFNIPYSLENGSLCRAKDGKVYTLCEKAAFQTGILCIDPDAEQQVQMVASEGLPTGAPHCSTLAKGKETDFIIWRNDGLYTYNLGDTFVHKVMEVYEAPLQWEGAECVTLEDGRVVFVKVFDCIFEEGGNPAGIPIPESTRICYVTLAEPSLENQMSFEYSNADELRRLELYTSTYYTSYEEQLHEIGTFSIKDNEGQEKSILEQGNVVDSADMYLVREAGTSGIIVISDILSGAKWEEGTLDSSYDYQITIGGEEYGYHSEGGAFINNEKNTIYEISEEERVLVDEIIGEYFSEK